VNPLFAIIEDLAAQSVEDLRTFIDESLATVNQVAANPAEYAEGRDLMHEMTEGVAAIEAARAELEAREAAAGEESPEEATEETATFDAAGLAELATRARGEDAEPEAEETEEEAPAEEAAAEPEELAAEVEETPEAPEAPEEEPVAEAVVASAPTAANVAVASHEVRRLPKPSRSRTPAVAEPVVPIIAAANGAQVTVGQEFGSELEVANAMIEQRRRFGNVAEGTHGDKVPIARATWSDLYPSDRYLGRDEVMNQERIQAVTAGIGAAFDERKKQGGSLTASGGLCAPVTPYYQLQMLSVADRPVRAALPSFNADRGGIRAATPAALTAITTAVDIITAAEDALGGTSATKSCQVIDCPPFVETDVAIIYHCLQFGNLGARTFPELVAQWNSLVLAAHARTAETHLLDGIGGASTHVTASALGLGASATLPSQILAAANGMRSRHRMRTDAVLRVLLPEWVKDLLVSDVYRSQFQRFDMDAARFVALLRAGNVEPTFYMDGQTGQGQVFGAQTASALLPFPSTIDWYIYPEGSFLYLDGGVLELGLVRDSVLNSTNDFQIFGESFENVAFVGVESLRVVSTTCDSGTVSAPHATTCPVSYS
jgi:hypothetical protein